MLILHRHSKFCFYLRTPPSPIRNPSGSLPSGAAASPLVLVTIGARFDVDNISSYKKWNAYCAIEVGITWMSFGHTPPYPLGLEYGPIWR